MNTPSALEQCRNCDTPLQGEYCHQCGQQNQQYLRSIFAVVGNLFGEIGHWDSRFYRTLSGLMLRPGFLTKEFVNGRHASYVPPLRLYFFISLIAFLTLSLTIDYEAMTAPGNEVFPTAGTEQPATPSTSEARQPPPPVSLDFGDARISLPFLGEAEQEKLNEKLRHLSQNPKILVRKLVSLAPQIILLMMPFWALYLKIIYIFKRHYYLEHLTAALHTHAFLLLSLTILTAMSQMADWLTARTGMAVFDQISDWMETILLMWMATYMLFTQKIFYNQGWGRTLIKFALSAIGYLALLSLAFVAMVIIGVMTA
ncbi:DUF3667 domain-containing protein [Pseudidiomarina sp.]|uniref:DUF3667 domain-containing protein n=1 Tax=Pseudidiomarina sp. TaxID=2081707 RepID=UPI00299F03A8|nr:DUF3667 domain-containing protein [Pseudidiomarina sp.]MDX1705371.1 DUF3667 domain-containing protein [Pseudidiomarina sp.]